MFHRYIDETCEHENLPDMIKLKRWITALGLLAWVLLVPPLVVAALIVAHPGQAQPLFDVTFLPELSETLPLIRADQAHRLGVTGQGVVVLVIDNFTPNPDDPCSTRFIHGEWVKGVVEAVAPDAEVRTIDVPLDVPGTPDRPCYGFSSSVLERALQNALAMQRNDPFQVVNYSIGGGRFTDWCDSGVSRTGFWIRRLVEEGALFVTASGNAGFTDAIGFPECMRETISVGAVYDYNDNTLEQAGVCSALPVVDKVTCYSNSAFMLDVLAPGSKVTVSPVLDSLGTSAASPHVAGVIALLLQLDPALTLEQVRDIFRRTGKPVVDHRNRLTFPRVDALAAAQDVLSRLNQPPQVSVRIEPEQPVAGRPVFFSADAFDPDGDPLTFAWVLDGEAQPTVSASTQWASPTEGAHTIAVTVSDGRGGQASAQRTFEVLAPGGAARTLALALDRNRNRVLDDAEIDLAITLWITGQAAPETELRIDDAAIVELIAIWILSERL